MYVFHYLQLLYLKGKYLKNLLRCVLGLNFTSTN